MVVGLIITMVFSWFLLRVKIRQEYFFIKPFWIGYGAELLIILFLSLAKRDIFINAGFIVALFMFTLADLIDEKKADLLPVVILNILTASVILTFTIIQ